jgi:hypothetical protein
LNLLVAGGDWYGGRLWRDIQTGRIFHDILLITARDRHEVARLRHSGGRAHGRNHPIFPHAGIQSVIHCPKFPCSEAVGAKAFARKSVQERLAAPTQFRFDGCDDLRKLLDRKERCSLAALLQAA